MTATATTAPAIGQEWPEQGGIYIGSRLIDGATHQGAANELLLQIFTR